jgi:hypothetical protein
MSVYRSAEMPTAVPRPIRQRPDVSQLARWLPRIIILPHTVVGLGAMLVAMVTLAGPALGTTTEGRVVSEQVSPSKGGAFVPDRVPVPARRAGVQRISFAADQRYHGAANRDPSCP